MKVAERPSGLLVANPDEMYDDDFVKHFNMRHADQLGGLPRILLEDERTVIMYREFHHKIHQFPYLFPFAIRNHRHTGIEIKES